MTSRPLAQSVSHVPSRNLATTAILTGVAVLSAPLSAQTPTTQELINRIEAQDQRIERLTKRLGNAMPASFEAPKQGGSGLTAAYDKGFRLRSSDPNSPFELKINSRMQFRYVGFASDDDVPVNPNRSDFEIERGRLAFAGTFLNKNTHFYIQLDADTDDNHRVIFHDFWVNYDIAKNHSIYVGKAFFPGTREYLNGSTRTHLIDRSMATTFFRPDRSIGVWAIGKGFDAINYRVMVANGIKTTDLKPEEVDDKFAYAASFWIDPFAKYGKGFADLTHHEELAMRFGTTLSYTAQEDGQGNAPTEDGVAEAGAVRLSDGDKLQDRGADQFDFHMATADAAMKYQGLSANCELFYRWIDDIEGALDPGIRTSYYDWGGYCDVGYMVIPKSLEPVVRVSTVQGAIRDSWEYAAGINYYVDGTHKNKFSFDISKLDGSPASSSSPNYRIDDDGWLFRIQWQIAF